MRTVKVRYSVTFEATIEVPDNATPTEIGEEVSNINIPEDDLSKYVEDTFDPEVDDNGDPKLFDTDGLVLVKHLYKDGECPDCGLEIPDNATVGENCENCEHVFNAPGENDDEEPFGDEIPDEEE